MILDYNTMFANDLAYNGTPTVIDLGATKMGPGRPIRIFVNGSSTLAGATGVTITDGPTNSAANALVTYTCTLAGKLVYFDLPPDVDQYVKVALAGSPSAGTWSAGLVMADQTAG